MAYNMKSSPTKLMGLLRRGAQAMYKLYKGAPKTKPITPPADPTGDWIRKTLQKQLSEPVTKKNPYVSKHPQTGKIVYQKYGKKGQGNIK